jgi:hypothetical protein
MVAVSSQKISDDGLHEYLESLLAGLTSFHAALAEEFFQ